MDLAVACHSVGQLRVLHEPAPGSAHAASVRFVRCSFSPQACARGLRVRAYVTGGRSSAEKPWCSQFDFEVELSGRWVLRNDSDSPVPLTLAATYKSVENGTVTLAGALRSIPPQATDCPEWMWGGGGGVRGVCALRRERGGADAGLVAEQPAADRVLQHLVVDPAQRTVARRLPAPRHRPRIRGVAQRGQGGVGGGQQPLDARWRGEIGAAGCRAAAGGRQAAAGRLQRNSRRSVKGK